MNNLRGFLKNHTHHVRRLRRGSYDRYECLDCGKRLRVLSGVIVENVEKYLEKQSADYKNYLLNNEQETK